MCNVDLPMEFFFLITELCLIMTHRRLALIKVIRICCDDWLTSEESTHASVEQTYSLVYTKNCVPMWRQLSRLGFITFYCLIFIRLYYTLWIFDKALQEFATTKTGFRASGANLSLHPLLHRLSSYVTRSRVYQPIVDPFPLLDPVLQVFWYIIQKMAANSSRGYIIPKVRR